MILLASERVISREMIFCNYCDKVGKKSTYQVLPKRYFGQIGKKIPMCNDCFSKIEDKIRQAEILPAQRYIELFEEFVRESYVERNR